MLPTSRSTYRPDIDGLRALAVLAVVVFHAHGSLMPGGFVGVDVFFVISGFLITGLIAEEIERGSFSFANFYTRRIKRIFPPYIAVAAATLAVSSYLLIPNDYIFYTTSLAASWAFLSNVFFSMLSWGYFGQRTEEFPLLHTWSLSVEEQFYFIFPILLILLYRYLRPKLIWALLALGIAFACYSQWKTGEIRSYFLISSRAHELIIGALTYFLQRKYPLSSRALAHLLAAAGLAMVLGSLFLIHSGTPFPGFNSLYPCIGTALLIYAGRQDHFLSPLLKSRPAVFIGLISYSLYLWHWPIFSFLRYRGIELNLPVSLAAVALAFVLSILTWKFIETPIRTNRGIRFKTAFTQIYLAPCVLFMAVGLYSYVTEGAPQRFSSDVRELIASYSFERDLTRSCSIRAEDYRKVTVDYLLDNCAFGNSERPKADVLLMGDSHANHFKPFIEQLSKNAGLKAVFHVQGGCMPTELARFDQQPQGEPSTCEKRNADLLALAGQFKYVVLAGFWSSAAGPAFERELASVVEQVSAAGATPVVFKDNPYYRPDLSRCVLKRKRGWIPADADCSIPYDFVSRTLSATDAAIDSVGKSHPKLVVIDPKRVMCNSEKCLTYIGNTALYKDDNHINAKAAVLLADRYIAGEGNPLGAHAGARLAERRDRPDQWQPQPRLDRTSADALTPAR
jgi:peptidoglycan/LPS O-acetylase OafA/YrhL